MNKEKMCCVSVWLDTAEQVNTLCIIGFLYLYHLYSHHPGEQCSFSVVFVFRMCFGRSVCVVACM